MTREALLLALGCAGVALLAAGVALDAVIARRRRAELRFDRYCLRLETERRAESVGELLSRNLAALVGPALAAFSRAFFARERDRVDMRKLLWAAGYRSEHALTALAAAKLGGAALGAGAGLAYALRGGGGIDLLSVAMIGGGGILGAIAPEMLLGSRRDARRGRIRNALPDAIDLMVIAAYAGQSLDMALDRISREMRAFAPDIAEELAIVTAELQALPDRTEALRNFGERVDLREARAFALTLIQTIRYGSPFTESLKALGGDLRQARMIAAEERGAKLPALLTLPLIVFIMPAVFVVVVGPAAISMGDMFAARP
jgi:tight adherence protein C